MAEFLNEAADFVFRDPRRALASDLSTKLSVHVEERLSHYDHFDQRYAAVSGSTCRDTHLPDDFDFDVGLLPAADRPDSEFIPVFEQFLSDLATQLSSDLDFCQALALVCGTWPTDIRDLLRNPERKNWEHANLTTYKFKFGGRSIIEVSAGRYPWHRFGLLYKSAWERQVARLASEVGRTTVSHICLLKRLAKDRGVYGDKGGGPASRGVEQLVMNYATDVSPLRALLQSISASTRPEDLTPILYPISDEQMIELGLKPVSRNVTRAFSSDGWKKYKQIAVDVLNWPN